jgi:arsenite methyltransferase
LEPTTIHEDVRAYYEALRSSSDLKTDATCCTSSAPPRYVAEVMLLIADEIMEKFYGCGSPIPPALEGMTVLDLGCGTGRDVYVLSKLVGQTGRVIGVDMTESQLAIARKYQQEQAAHFGYETSNVEFCLGYIEDLASCKIADESIDLVVSNCVVNLSPFKDKVLSEVFRVLKPGGELYFSDIYSDRRMSEELRHDPVLVGECLGGALYETDFHDYMSRAGWPYFVYSVIDDMHVGNLNLQTKLGFISFTSRTVRAIKAEGLESHDEDYGQQATYLGGMKEMPRYFDFSHDVRFIKGKPMAVSANTARMLAASRYGKYFEISNAGAHRGTFDELRAQRALQARIGKLQVDAKLLQSAYDRMDYKSFEERVDAPSLLKTNTHQKTMQVNITYACNLECKHCYLECGPEKKERMSRDVMQACLDAFFAGGFEVMDITGGSPELHPDFEWFLRESAKLGNVIVRTNLTLLELPRYEHLMDVFVQVGARVVASLPFYEQAGADSQRGNGVFERCIRVVKSLNGRGYGMGMQRVSALAKNASVQVAEGASGQCDASQCAQNAGAQSKELILDLVYNVSGPFLPPPQDMIEQAYRVRLEQEQGIHFNNLLAFNNYAVGRFAQDLLDAGMLDTYLALLADNFNAMAVTRLMCLDQINVDYDGRIYDCEVNHVLKLPVQVECAGGDCGEGASANAGDDAYDEKVCDENRTSKTRDATIFDFKNGQLPQRHARTHPVCYSCTAGSGSSCGGALV